MATSVGLSANSALATRSGSAALIQRSFSSNHSSGKRVAVRP
jgi:hypothetical protein